MPTPAAAAAVSPVPASKPSAALNYTGAAVEVAVEEPKTPARKRGRDRKVVKEAEKNRLVRATKDYVAHAGDDDELSLKRGDSLKLLGTDEVCTLDTFINTYIPITNMHTKCKDRAVHTRDDELRPSVTK